MMRVSAYRRLVALLLGIVLTLGAAISPVRAAGMSMKMDLAMSSGAANAGGCGACGAGEQSDAMQAACVSVCMTSATAILAAPLSVAIAATAPVAWPERASLHGKIASPEPHPPKSSD